MDPTPTPMPPGLYPRPGVARSDSPSPPLAVLLGLVLLAAAGGGLGVVAFVGWRVFRFLELLVP